MTCLLYSYSAAEEAEEQNDLHDLPTAASLNAGAAPTRVPYVAYRGTI